MKTEKISGVQSNFKLFIVLPVAALLIATMFSCGQDKESAASKENKAPAATTAPNDNSVFVEVDSMPIFKNGDQGLLDYIATNTVYPDEAKKKGITGKVIVKFIVEKDCTVSHAEILRGVDPLLDAAALKVVSSIPKFEKPAIKDGAVVSVYYMVPITFQLN